MEFTTTTDYDMKTLTAIARALRKTVRKKRSRRAHIFGWIVVLLGTFLLLPPAGMERGGPPRTRRGKQLRLEA